MGGHRSTVIGRKAVDDGQIHLSTEYSASWPLGSPGNPSPPRETEGAFDNGAHTHGSRPRPRRREGVFREWQIPHALSQNRPPARRRRRTLPADVLAHDDTRGSRRISSLIASFSAWIMVICRCSYLCLCHASPPAFIVDGSFSPTHHSNVPSYSSGWGWRTCLQSSAGSG